MPHSPILQASQKEDSQSIGSLRPRAGRRHSQSRVLAEDVEYVLLHDSKLVLEALSDVALADPDALDDVVVLASKHAESVGVEPVPVSGAVEEQQD